MIRQVVGPKCYHWALKTSGQGLGGRGKAVLGLSDWSIALNSWGGHFSAAGVLALLGCGVKPCLDNLGVLGLLSRSFPSRLSGCAGN
jgi:hypothetical protein